MTSSICSRSGWIQSLEMASCIPVSWEISVIFGSAWEGLCWLCSVSYKNAVLQTAVCSDEWESRVSDRACAKLPMQLGYGRAHYIDKTTYAVAKEETILPILHKQWVYTLKLVKYTISAAISQPCRSVLGRFLQHLTYYVVDSDINWNTIKESLSCSGTARTPAPYFPYMKCFWAHTPQGLMITKEPVWCSG